MVEIYTEWHRHKHGTAKATSNRHSVFFSVPMYCVVGLILCNIVASLYLVADLLFFVVVRFHLQIDFISNDHWDANFLPQWQNMSFLCVCEIQLKYGVLSSSNTHIDLHKNTIHFKMRSHSVDFVSNVISLFVHKLTESIYCVALFSCSQLPKQFWCILWIAFCAFVCGVFFVFVIFVIVVAFDGFETVFISWLKSIPIFHYEKRKKICAFQKEHEKRKKSQRGHMSLWWGLQNASDSDKRPISRSHMTYFWISQVL